MEYFIIDNEKFEKEGEYIDEFGNLVEYSKPLTNKSNGGKNGKFNQ